MRLKNVNHDTPAGWKFNQSAITPKPIAAHSFGALVKEVVKIRKANPGITKRDNLSTDSAVVAQEVEAQIVAKLIAMGNANHFLTEDSASPLPKTFPPQWPTPLNGVAAVAASGSQPSIPPSWLRKLGNVAAGVKTLADWLGDSGIAVAKELSEKRASKCAKCPLNLSGDLSSFFTKPVSELIRRQLIERNELKLSTSQDEKLGICDACGCPIKLLVHVPLEYKLKHIPSAAKASLHPECWVLEEEKALTTSQPIR